MNVSTSSPFGEAYRDYFDAGFQPIRARPDKSPLDSGVTGWNGQPHPIEQLEALAQENGSANIGLRLTGDLVGLDVDDYDDKHGGDTWRQAIDAHGEPPDTWISTSRDGISGIRLFRWPVQVSETNKPENLPGIDAVHTGLRHMMVAPSNHPEGRKYRWIKPDGSDAEPGEYPNADNIPRLPGEWVTHFRKGCMCFLEPEPPGFDWDRWKHSGDGPERPIKDVMNRWRQERTTDSRHVATVRAVAGLHALEQWPGYAEARHELDTWFLTNVSPDRTGGQRAAEAELKRMWDGAAKKYTPRPFDERSPTAPAARTEPRTLKLTPASAIKPRPVWWLWHNRVPTGEMTLTPGYAGTGKSTFHAWIISQITNGTLPGIHQGKPRNVIICASEDSWSRSIVPRLMAVGANLDRVFQLGVTGDGRVSLPTDNDLLEQSIIDKEVALVSLDPILSLIDDELDDYRSKELRKALEPLRDMADRTGCAILANAHFNKAGGLEPLQKISGSSAWGEVCRAAIAFAYDNDNSQYVMSQIKNNLGPIDHNSQAFNLVETEIPTDDGPSRVTRLEWIGDAPRGVRDVLGSPPISGEEATDRETAAGAMLDILASGPERWEKIWPRIKGDEGISERTAIRGRDRLKADGLIEKLRQPDGRWYWATTEKGRDSLPRVGVGQVGQVGQVDENGEQLGQPPGQAAALGGEELCQLGQLTTTSTRDAESTWPPTPETEQLGHPEEAS